VIYIDGMGRSGDSHGCSERTLENLPTEVLVYIVSFLPDIREKAKLRYVSRTLRGVCEASSLWNKFVWPQYDSREELSVKSLLTVCAHHVKRISFPDHVRLSMLLRPLSGCCKLTQLSLPSAKLVGMDPEQFGNTLQHMKQLERLEIRWDSSINPLLLAGCPKLKDLTVHAASSQIKWAILWPHEWVTNKFVPHNLNIIVEVSKYVLMQKLLEAWPLWNSFSPSDHSAELRLYSHHGFQVPLNLFSALPMFQLHFNQTAMLPFVKAATFGLLGMESIVLILSDTNNARHKAEFVPSYHHEYVQISGDQLDSRITSLDFITHFDARCCQFLYSGNLEQLAAACPNLHRLDVESRSDCLGNLQGLRMIANSCYCLQGLNLQGIGFRRVEDCLQLWEILSSMQLTHLAVETCVLKPFADDALLQQQLVRLFQKCLSLVALECSDGFCDDCRHCSDPSLSSFPSLIYCKVQSSFAEDIINNCEKLQCFNVNSSKSLSFSSLHNNGSLTQLCIRSHLTVLTHDIMKTLSSHGRLVHVVLCVFSVTCSGVITLIANSPMLITLHIITSHCDEEDEFSLEVILSERFSRRKLFTAGSFSYEQKSLFVTSDIVKLQQNTDLLSLWS